MTDGSTLTASMSVTRAAITATVQCIPTGMPATCPSRMLCCIG
jgi:hypothetical protein